MIEYLFAPFQLPYMERALLSLVVLGVAAGLIGMFVNLRGLEFISDGLTHAVFPGIVIGYVLGDQRGLMIGALIAAVTAATVLTWVAKRGTGHDAGIAVVLTATFSVGILVVSTSTNYVAELEALLFGRLLTVTDEQLVQNLVICTVAVIAVILTFRAQLFRAFDTAGATAAGYRVFALDLVLNVAIALVVVSASRTVGNLLVLAFLIIPAASARNLTHRLGALIPFAIVLAVGSSWFALVVSFDASITADLQLSPAGTVVLVMTLVYALTLLWRFGVLRLFTATTRRQEIARAGGRQ